MGLAANVEHVTDVREIVRYGVMGSPALVISGRVVSVGQVPERGKIKSGLRKLDTNGKK